MPEPAAIPGLRRRAAATGGRGGGAATAARRPGSGLPEVRLAGERLADAPEATRVVLLARKGDGGPEVLAGVDEVQERYALVLADELALQKHGGEAGSVAEIPVSAPDDAVERVLVVGVGDGGEVGLRRGGAAAARKLRGCAVAAVAVPATSADGVRALVEGALLGAYSFAVRSKEPAEADRPVGRLDLVVARPRSRRDAVERAVTTARAVHVARDLANTPSSEKDPAWLAARAEELAAGAGVTVRVRDEQELAAEGFGGILAVGMGSTRPPRLIELRYEPDGAGPRTPHVVLVGKGITFDTGGLSLKRPYDVMVAMKTDMAAGGAVIAAMSALRDLGVKARVTGLVAAAENMPSGSAQRPGDVIRHYGGRTSEVLNTDAEGRLVLADALAYADSTLAPDVLVDLATLTGAATLGLGKRHAALYTADERLAAAFTDAGERSGDRVWRMPLVEDYRDALRSDVADIAHVSTDKHVGGGSITAALFLREFVGGRRWVHLDIAGPGRADADEHEVSKGATGFGARLLLRWLETMRGTR